MALLGKHKVYPACVEGAGAAPPQDCGGPGAYAALLDEHAQPPPLDALPLMADAMGRFLEASDDEKVGEVVGELDALRRAVDQVQAYHELSPDRLDRRRINRRLRQYADGDECWRTE
jgi:hypothetical protein